MKKIRLTVGNIVMLAVFAVLLGALIFGNCMCAANATQITAHLSGSGIVVDSDKAQTALAEGDELVQNIAEEGIVLLKNNGVLPLKVPASGSYKINLFGVGSTDDGFAPTGVGGSGVGTIVKEDILNADGTVKFKKNYVPFRQGLESEGFEVNAGLLSKYESGNPDPSFYSSADPLLTQAKQFSDTAIVTITRKTGENSSTLELTDPGKDSLWLTEAETAMIDWVSENFEKVILLFNSTNLMEMGVAENEKIDAAFNLGVIGQSGSKAFARLLNGKVSPSGKMAATAPYDTESDPTFANVIRTGSGLNKQITYAEDIYVGYKWYETADAEGYFDGVNNEYGKGYDGVVQYPFGYGLSYTAFRWELERVAFTVDNETEDAPADGMLESAKTAVSVSVDVTNVGETAGKDVVQLYYSAPYYPGEIEKSYVNLVAFGKTGLLDPGESETVTLTFDVYDMASYDCYDKNGNGIKGWELDPGKYALKLMKNAHTPSEISDLTVEVPAADVDDGRKGYVWRFDPDTKGYVKNRFTGDSAEADVPIDGSTTGDPIRYLSRADFKGTFPSERTPGRDTAKLTAPHNYYYTGWDDMKVARPTINRTEGEMLYLYTLEGGAKAGQKDLDGEGETLVANEKLIMELGSDYDSELWDTLLSQLSEDDIELTVGAAGFGTKALESVGKPAFLDIDGPSGFNSKMAFKDTGLMWTAFPGEAVVACTFNKDLAYQMGVALAKESKVSGGMTGLYAPNVNLHRTPYNTRNYEAYSEDPVISGYMGAEVIRGAKNHGLSCYLKHLALSEAGWNPNDVNTWLTEQNFRENYLKSFEIAVKEGGANSVMSAFNCIGAVRAVNNYSLLTKVLRDEWGFEGVVITDYNMGESKKHVRSGNDLHLNPESSGSNYAWMDKFNDTDVYCGYQAVKNTLYAYCNTYYTAKTYDPNANLSLGSRESVFAWWILLLVLLDVVCVGAMGWFVFRMFKPSKRKLRKLQAAEDGGADGPSDKNEP